MKVCLWCTGKTSESWIKTALQEYQDRLKNYLTFEYRELPVAKGKQTPQAHKEADKAEVLKLLKAHDTFILLDEGGKEFSSIQFSKYLDGIFSRGGGNIIFLSGGAFGFHEDIKARATYKISLSKLTFTHQMARLIFMEQLYRAMTILKGEPYHHA